MCGILRRLQLAAALGTILAMRFGRFRSLTSSPVYQLGEIGHTDEPGRLLSPETKHSTRQHLCWGSSARLLEAQAEVLGRDARERDVGFSKFSQQPEKSAIHNMDLLW
jgi:hypothetical protein